MQSTFDKTLISELANAHGFIPLALFQVFFFFKDVLHHYIEQARERGNEIHCTIKKENKKEVNSYRSSRSIKQPSGVVVSLSAWDVLFIFLERNLPICLLSCMGKHTHVSFIA
jgi:hypothetical protein